MLSATTLASIACLIGLEPEPLVGAGASMRIVEKIQGGGGPAVLDRFVKDGVLYCAVYSPLCVRDGVWKDCLDNDPQVQPELVYSADDPEVLASFRVAVSATRAALELDESVVKPRGPTTLRTSIRVPGDDRWLTFWSPIHYAAPPRHPMRYGLPWRRVRWASAFSSFPPQDDNASISMVAAPSELIASIISRVDGYAMTEMVNEQRWFASGKAATFPPTDEKYEDWELEELIIEFVIGDRRPVRLDDAKKVSAEFSEIEPPAFSPWPERATRAVEWEVFDFGRLVCAVDDEGLIIDACLIYPEFPDDE